MSPTRADLLAAVNAAPAGLTTAQAAALFNYGRQEISNKMSKLHAYGFIGRVEIPGNRKSFTWTTLNRDLDHA